MPKPNNPRVTKERLRELFAYDPLRGEVQRRVTVGYNAKAGDIVGSKHSQGYLTVCVDGEVFLLHRLIWVLVYGTAPGELIDHVNGDKQDNRLENLREVTISQNSANTLGRAWSKTGIPGVQYYPHPVRRIKRWAAYIAGHTPTRNKRQSLGYYLTKLEAVRARRQAELGSPHSEVYARSSACRYLEKCAMLEVWGCY